MGFMSGFFGSAATAYEQTRQENERLRLEQERNDLEKMRIDLQRGQLDTNTVKDYYDRAMSSWGKMSASERIGVVGGLSALGTNFNQSGISAYDQLFQAQVRDTMGVSDAKAYLANLVTATPDPDNPYGAVPQWIVNDALKVLENSGDPDAETIIADVNTFLTGQAEDAAKIATNFWALQGLEVDQARANVAATEAGTRLTDANVMAQSIINGYLDDRQREELRNIMNANTLDEALFDSIVSEAEAKSGISQSQLRVLVATEAFDIAIREGQAEQVPFLLQQLQSNIALLDADTQRILLNNEITEETKAAEVGLAIQRERLARSQANVAEATESSQISTILAESRSALANATMAELRADQYGQELAANLAQVLAVTANTQADVDLKHATFENAVKKYAAETNIAESTARVYLATEAFKIAVAAQEPGLVQAQIQNFWSNTRVNNTQADLALPRMVAELIQSGDPATLSQFGEQLLRPRFGDNWEDALGALTAAAQNSASVAALETNVEIAYRRALTQQAESSTAVNRASLTPQAPQLQEIFADVKSGGNSSLSDIRGREVEATELDLAMTQLASILRDNDFVPEDLAGTMSGVMGILGLEPDMLGEVSLDAGRRVLAFATNRLNTLQAQNAAEMSIYLAAATDAGFPPDPTLFGLDRTNPEDMALWERVVLRSPQAQLDIQQGFIWDAQFGEAFVDAITPLQTLYAPALYHNAEGLTDYEAIMAPVVEELKEKMGLEAWEAAGAPTGEMIYETFFAPELKNYDSVYQSVLGTRTSLSNLGIEFNPDDRQSLREASTKIRQTSEALSQLQTRAIRSSQGSWLLRDPGQNLLAPQNDSEIIEEVMELFNLPPQFFIDNGIAQGYGNQSIFSSNKVFTGVNLDALVDLNNNILELFSNSTENIADLYSRYR